ncbi:acetoacetate decarboxylase family protein [Nocardioides mesophilus]|uniref:Acetoacetate decarboxylase family protein n=1 Tax=Nocardioides mesophilus TaxID=433659 RepID=A0A7G9RFE3_9ACTN|nr:acetoacetate decarboxylase family protein [Nocardioides mesophilus]QNN54318.1 acetoacetate decarboxylase family protein [Nocardioides mesophilus]
MSFPSPPWRMRAEMWLSLFRVPAAGRADRPAGLYGAAFADYRAGSPLTYRELLVARLLEPRRRRLRITDIWVDSPASRDGGRSLWAIPKELGDLSLAERRTGPVVRTALALSVEGRPVASARFRALPGAALLPVPYAAWASQLRPGAPAGSERAAAEVLTSMRGTTRVAPARADWEVDPDGPLAFLRGQRPFLSVRLTGIRLTFGG